jgi:hypothetical protein
MAPIRNLEREAAILQMIKSGRPIRTTARHFGVSEQHVRVVLERHNQPPPRVMAAQAMAEQSPIGTLPPTNNVTPFMIEKGVPVPGSPAIPLYPLEEMEVGDSFLVPCDPKVRQTRKKRVDGMIYLHRRRNPECGKKWRSAQVATGVRVWRIK